MAIAAPERLHFTGDDEADVLIAHDPLALLIGFALDQQVSVPKAFSAPLELKRRLGGIEAERIAATDPGELEEVFRRKPALHRFPGAMAQRVQDLASTVVEDYGGRAERIWTEARDAADLRDRIAALPGFGNMKVRSLLAVLAKRFGVQLDGLDVVLPTHPTLGDVDSPEAFERYQAAKRAYKARMRSQAG
jgi:uncharacterized HhH-GPD family protein